LNIEPIGYTHIALWQWCMANIDIFGNIIYHSIDRANN